MKNKENWILFKKWFEETFYNTKLKTEKFNEFYQNIEMIMDEIAGPFYAIYTDGSCDYVLKENSEVFKRIKSCDDYLNWCLDIVKDYKNRVNEFKANNYNEEKDKEVLLSKAIVMEKMSYIAFDIQKERWNE